MKPDRMLAAALLISSSGYLAAALQITEPEVQYAAVGPRAFPVVIGLSLIACAAWIGLARKGAAQKLLPLDWRPLLLSALLFLVYISLLETVGYVTATVLFITLESRLLGSRSWLRNLTVGLCVGSAVYVIFSLLLRIGLPSGLIG